MCAGDIHDSQGDKPSAAVCDHSNWLELYLEGPEAPYAEPLHLGGLPAVLLQ